MKTPDLMAIRWSFNLLYAVEEFMIKPYLKKKINNY